MVLITDKKGSMEAEILSHDHKPTSAEENARLAKLNARVHPRIFYTWHGQEEMGPVRVWDTDEEYGLALSRTVGDFKLAPYVISDPELIVRPMEPTDVALIAASDGLWDVMENEEVAAFLVNQSPQRAAQNLMNEATHRWNRLAPDHRDDITVIVLPLK